MSKPRVNVKLAALVAEVNRRNRESTCAPEVRKGWNELLATALMLADAYSGFGYLDSSMVPAGELPGYSDTGGTFSYPDETRRHYYAPKT